MKLLSLAKGRCTKARMKRFKQALFFGGALCDVYQTTRWLRPRVERHRPYNCNLYLWIDFHPKSGKMPGGASVCTSYVYVVATCATRVAMTFLGAP